jgi:putative addiction module component (TIGR02574 family)
MRTQLEEALKLPINERIKLVEDIWDSIVAETRAPELTPEQKAELDRRIEYSRLKPEDVIPWNREGRSAGAQMKLSWYSIREQGLISMRLKTGMTSRTKASRYALSKL